MAISAKFNTAQLIKAEIQKVGSIPFYGERELIKMRFAAYLSELSRRMAHRKSKEIRSSNESVTAGKSFSWLAANGTTVQ